jgi:hypothetical protein
MRHPLILPRLWLTLGRPTWLATLMSIDVAPDTKRSGVGKWPVTRFQEELQT